MRPRVWHLWRYRGGIRSQIYHAASDRFHNFASLQYRENTGVVKSDVLIVHGRYHDVVDFANSIVYHPDTDWYGAEMLSIYVNDLGNIGVDGPMSHVRSIIINVKEVNDAPQIILPDFDMLALEDSTGIIGTDAYNWQNTDNETDYLSAGEYLDVSWSNMSSSSIRIVDRDSAITSRLQRVVLRNTTNNGTWYNDENDGYDLWYNTTYFTNTNSDVLAYQYDVTNTTEALKKFTVTLSVEHGTMTMIRISDDIELLHGSGLLDDYIVMEGKLIAINEALRGLNYVPDRNWNSYQGSR